MDLVLEMCNTNSIHWCGISGRQLGKLHPSSSLCLALTLLSSVQGLQVCALFSNFSMWGLFSSGHLLFPFFSSGNYQWMKIYTGIFLSIECLRLTTNWYVLKENIWIRWHRTGLCGIFGHQSGELKTISSVLLFVEFNRTFCISVTFVKWSSLQQK